MYLINFREFEGSLGGTWLPWETARAVSALSQPRDFSEVGALGSQFLKSADKCNLRRLIYLMSKAQPLRYLRSRETFETLSMPRSRV